MTTAILIALAIYSVFATVLVWEVKTAPDEGDL